MSRLHKVYIKFNQTCNRKTEFFLLYFLISQMQQRYFRNSKETFSKCNCNISETSQKHYRNVTESFHKAFRKITMSGMRGHLEISK